VSKNDTVYTVYIAGVSCTPTAERYIIVIVRLSNATVELEISAVIADLADVFSQQEAGVLPLYGRNVYIIDLDGREPPFGPLYNLLVAKLEVIRTYIDTSLAKR
jgi:hypothetical protein